ncbi:MAG: sensor domain-containing diguanylate cyclase [Candidatus Omnitrophota bacterium]|jgi:diguanylate cyclase (GGDEF)-like protein
MRRFLTKTLLILILLSSGILYTVIRVFGEYPQHIILAAILIILDFFILFIFMHRNSEKGYYQDFKIEELREKLNILNTDNTQEQLVNSAILAKTARYNSLKLIIEKLNQDLKLEAVTDCLTDTAFSLIAANRGTCLVFLVDEDKQKLNLVKSKKEDRELVIKAKEGDIFDNWVMRHSNPLIIEDIRKDYRFDLDKLKSQEIRLFSSLVSAPLATSNSVIGLLRLDNQQPGYFSQDDLRFLSLLADLGAVAIENSQFFCRTQDLAIHDDLTGLFTKSYFVDRLKEESKRCIRINSCLSLLMIDIDFFKQYNDKFGHTAGDIVLKKISAVMKDFLKDHKPLLSRFGGEEFLVLLPGLAKKEAFVLAEQLRQQIGKEKIILRRQDTFVTVSIGLASEPLDTKDEDELIQLADKAMYAAKQKGRNLVCSI